eukprot:TRINITY_DN9679_c0_g2_i2.p1 TRINITY_DN9679_c0_g2~~TRINITY_DN9679_c0_g2_i2.p1  ORF type:complete len:214 (+),score=48.43 TRINITY_DN9679_c0_g2_i2:701-1342(+)
MATAAWSRATFGIVQGLAHSRCCGRVQFPAEEFLAQHAAGQLGRAPLDLLRKLWADPTIQTMVSRSHEFQLPDNTQYIYNAIDRIAADDYIPSIQDILHARFATTGIVEFRFKLPRVELKVIDVGGQRSQRRKWMHCFEDVTAVLFISSLSEYDQVLAEDGRTNRVVESLNLFRVVAREPWFRRASMIVFLNKVDLLEQKLARRKRLIGTRWR